MTSTLVIIPTYNEALAIRSIIARVRAAEPKVSILIVDDGSPDGTGDIADELALNDSKVNVLHRTAKEGLGAAYLAGFDWALDAGFDVVVEMDADGSHRPEELGRLLVAIETSDAVIGSRWVAGGGVVDWPLERKLLSRGGSAYARFMLGLSLRDITAGYRAYRASTLRAVLTDPVHSAGYCFQIDMTRRIARAGLSITEVPIMFAERTVGTSKMTLSIVVEAMLRVTVWGIQDRLPLRRQAAATSSASRIV